MNDSGVYSSIYPVGNFPFPLPKMGSLTVEESEYMTDRVRSIDIQRLESIEKFATAISEKENTSLEEAIVFITKLVDGRIAESGTEEEKEKENNRLMSFSIKYREFLTELRKQNDPVKINSFQTKAIALMILVSRLDTQWLIENLSRINKNFRLSLEPKTISELLAISEEQWLSSSKRTEIFTRIINKLPTAELRELAGFALAEEREWESIDEETPQEEKKYSSGYEIIEIPSENNENSIEPPIIKLPPVELPIPSSTESDIIDVPVTSSGKRSKKLDA